jgi:hypothetical protein
MGVEVRRGDPRDQKPGRRIVIPEHPSQMRAIDVDLDGLRKSYLRHALREQANVDDLCEVDLRFLADETRTGTDYVKEVIDELAATTG